MSEQSEPHVIRLPDGDTLVPRKYFAENVLGVSDKTAKRMNLPGTLVGGVAHVLHDASLQVVAAKVHRKNQPAPTTPKPRANTRARWARSARR